MQLLTLKVFCDVVRWASFSRGASENGVSQSSASQAIHGLEKRLGVKLIDRSHRPLVPTPQGKAFYEGAKEIVGRYLELENRIKSLENDRNVVGTVGVASIYSVGMHHMSRFIEGFHLRYPAAHVRLEYLHPTRVVESVRNGLSELGFVSFPRHWNGLTIIPWREEEMALAVPPKHRFAEQSTVEIGQLDGEKFVTFDADLSIRKAIDKFLRKYGVQVETALEFDNIEHIKRAVEIAAGVAILPLPSMAREIEARSLVAVPFRDHRLSRPLAIIHRDGPLGLTAARFLQFINQDSNPPSDQRVGELAVGNPS